MEILTNNFLVCHVNQRLKATEPSKVILASVGSTVALYYLYNQLGHRHPWVTRVRKAIFSKIRSLPLVRSAVQQQRDKAKEDFEQEMLSYSAHLDDFLELPEEGLAADQVLEITSKYMALSRTDWEQGSESGTVYNGSPELTDLLSKMYSKTAWSNPLHPDAFPGIRKMEAEIVRMCCDMFHAGSASCGVVSSGGTESIILACKAYRDYAMEEKGISEPVMVVPVTAHAAFDKAAELLDMGIRHVKVDPKTQKVDLKAMKGLITRSTCMLVGSAPQFPHGSMDDIEGIAALGLAYKLPVHVDACLGGFLIPFMDEAGYPLGKGFDFRVKGVTSISADTHKYGFAPKGSSVLMYSEPKYRHYQWFTFVDWPGGIYATATISGSRSGATIAGCWAALIHHGKSGYIESTSNVIATTRFISDRLRNIDGIHIVGEPEVSVVAFGSSMFNIYAMADLLKKQHWNLNILQHPPCIHLCCTILHTKPGVAERFVADIKEVSKLLLTNPDIGKSKSAAIYGMAQSIPDRGAVDQIAWTYLDALYCTKDKKPS